MSSGAPADRPHPAGMGLGRKLTLAFGGMLAIVLAVGVTSVVVLGGYSRTLERIFRENYDSVHYATEMKEAVDVLDGIAERALWNEPDAGVGPAALARFRENLDKELRNITLPGEAETAASLERAWEGYESALQHSLTTTASMPERRRFYQTELLTRAATVKRLAQRIVDLNMANMVSVDGEVRLQAIRMRRTMYALMLLASVLAVLLTVVMARNILTPLRRLTESARQIEGGNLDLAVEVRSSDELGQLAEAFNAMAARLRELRRSDRARLVRTERTTQLALDSFPDAVAVIGLDGRIELANEAAERHFDLRPGSDLSADRHAALRRIVADTLATREPFRPDGYQSVLKPVSGEDRYFQPQAVPIPGEDGTLAGLTLVLADVTSLRHLDQTKSNLLSVVSHELRTPLTSIRMATHLLEEGKAGPLTPRQHELAAAAREDSERLHAVVESLLDIGRLQSGRALLELEPVSAATLAEDAFREFEARYRQAGVELARSIDAEAGDVLVDVQRFCLVFTNLLENALRFCSAGERVTIGASRDGSSVWFTVADEGKGIPAAHLPKVFDRFYRVPGQDRGSGAGLGLAIVKEVVEAHGGSVSVESTPGRGATFRVRLPLAPAHSSW